MPRKIILTPEAADDLDAAYAWYEENRPGLGEEFFRCVEACVETIRRNPESCLIVYEEYRRGLVRHFPYAIFYEAHSNKIIIYAVFHTSQDPVKWRRRFS